MKKMKTTGWVIAAISLVVFVVSVGVMSQKLEAYNERKSFSRWRFEPILNRQFSVYGRDVSLMDAVDEKGNTYLELIYGQQRKLIPVKAPPAPDVPDLGVYAEWAKVILVYELSRAEDGNEAEMVDDSGRVFLVTRRTPAGYDPESWGSVKRESWVFHFYELMPDGSVEQWRRRWPRKKRGEERLQAQEDHPLKEIPPLKERTLEFRLALHVIPKLNVPGYKFNETALEAVGWTMPVAGAAVLGLIAGVAVAVAPPRRTKEQEESSQ